MFKAIKKRWMKYKVTSEDLAVPEVHTGKADLEECDGETQEKAASGKDVGEAEEEISYDMVAIPEIHIRANK